MSNRSMTRAWHFGRKTKVVEGSFATNGSSAVDATTIKNTLAIASVVRNSAGNFTVTLRDGYSSLSSKLCGVSCSTNTDIVAQFGVISNVGSATGAAVSFVIRLLTGSTETDLAANADNIISFQIVFRDTVAS